MKSFIKNILSKLGYKIEKIKYASVKEENFLNSQSIKPNSIRNLSIKLQPERDIVVIGAHDLKSFDDLSECLTKYRYNRLYLFEPRKTSYSKLIYNIKELNIQNAIPVNLAIHSSKKEMHIYQVKECELEKYPKWAEGIASSDINHVKKTAEIDDIEMLICKCSNPDNWHRDYGINKISYLQIDVEGFDYEILKSINLIHYDPLVIKFEHANLKKNDLLQAARYLKSLGYDLIKDKEDIIAFKLSGIYDS